MKMKSEGNMKKLEDGSIKSKDRRPETEDQRPKLENSQLNECLPELDSGSVACLTGQDRFRTKREKTRVLAAGNYNNPSPKGRITKNNGRKAHSSWLETNGYRYENSIATQCAPLYPLKGTSLKVVPDGKGKVSRISLLGIGGSIALIYENSTVQHSKRLGLTAHTESSVFDELTIKAC